MKIERSISKLARKAEEEGGGGEGKLTDQEASRLAQLKEDLDYVMHFPPGERYVSLLKDGATPEAQAHVLAERARLRLLVRSFNA